MAGFITDAAMARRLPDYPARKVGSGRRAREVMPAAMKAEVSTQAVWAWKHMDAKYAGRLPGMQAEPGREAPDC
jgi:hypothetical protein